MSEVGQVELRPLTEGDVPAAMRLKELARWNQTEADWRRLLRLAPRGCFAALIGGRVVATTTTTSYGRELAWIGMVLVEPEQRRRGIATRLMRAALDYLRDEGVRTVKLDATPAGRPVYEALGFKTESLVERWQGAAPSEGPKETAPGVELPREDLLALDRRAFGADRAALLTMLIDEATPPPAVIDTATGRVEGYALARRGTAAHYVGPLVAADRQVAAELLDRVLGQLTAGPVYVDLNTNFAGGAQILEERGFSRQRELIRMSYGAPNPAGTSELVFAIAGPEVG